jgi:hypothetical protein
MEGYNFQPLKFKKLPELMENLQKIENYLTAEEVDKSAATDVEEKGAAQQ